MYFSEQRATPMFMLKDDSIPEDGGDICLRKLGTDPQTIRHYTPEGGKFPFRKVIVV